MTFKVEYKAGTRAFGTVTLDSETSSLNAAVAREGWARVKPDSSSNNATPPAEGTSGGGVDMEELKRLGAAAEVVSVASEAKFESGTASRSSMRAHTSRDS